MSVFSLVADITEVATCSREYCELCHRTYPDVTDVKMALVDVGKYFFLLTEHWKANQEKSEVLGQN